MVDLSAFCQHFYASRYLPLVYYEQDTPIYSAGFPDNTPLYRSVKHILLSASTNPAVYTAPDTGIYGMIRLKETNGYFLLGPAYSGIITQDTIRSYMALNAVPKEKESAVAQFLCAVPHYSYNRFLNLLIFLHLILNGEEVPVTENFGIMNQAMEDEIASRHARETYLARENGRQHGTYFFEKQLLEYVRSGNVSRTRQFLQYTVTKQPLNEGKLADDPLRQAKNLFIGHVTMIGKDGAIPGGMDIEQTYQLIDTYIQECEHIQSLDAIKKLQFNMIIDFTGRVAQSKMPDGVTGEIYACMQYIDSRLNEMLTIQDIADYIGKSRTYTAQKFKQETGKTVGEYITGCRMREAKSLLKYTDKSISEISEYLHFSSQPYFQSVFKQFYGVTPAKYRSNQKVHSF